MNCFVCDEPLDDDNAYGSEDLPLCRWHHEAYQFTVAFMVNDSRWEEIGKLPARQLVMEL